MAQNYNHNYNYNYTVRASSNSSSSRSNNPTNNLVNSNTSSGTSSPSTFSPKSTTTASSSSSSATTRTGWHVRGRLLAAANKAVSSASAFVNNVRSDGAEDEEDSIKTSKPNPYTEERCLVFVGRLGWKLPGFAYIRDNQLNVSIEGFAFRLRPLGSASRTQKLFVSAARQLTSLPSLPKTTLSDEPLDIELPPEELERQEEDYERRLLQEQQPGQLPSSSSPSSSLPSTSADAHSFSQSTPASSQSDNVRNIPAASSRQNTQSSINSVASDASSSSLLTAAKQSLTISRKPPVSFSNATLDVLHDNLHTRLRLFFSQKLVGRRIRVSVFLIPQPGQYKDSQELCVAKGILVTELGGIFKSSLCVPWTSGDPTMRKLRVRTELLSEFEETETIDDEATLQAVMKRSDEASVGLSHAHAPVRVISDIDDTIKITHVLAGMKAIMRNVFTRPHDELVVPGMQEWYWNMHERGASFHYLSNSPYEIFGVLRDYLHVTGFPPGSIRLKDYGGGSSLLGGLWESASARKRGGAEEILKTFPESQFVMVGDSGEQDLELYTSLANQYPHQVRNIFIRDVTTSVPKRLTRRTSDLEQQRVLEALAAEEKAKRAKNRSSPTSSDELDDADEFSPNNPLDRNLPSSGTLAPFDEDGYTEVERRVFNVFADRVHRAKSQLPSGTSLHIFRTGDECIGKTAGLFDDTSQ